MNRLSYFAVCGALFLLIGCKEEQQPTYDKWDSRPIRNGDRALSWFLTRYDSTMYDIALDSITKHSGNWAAHIFSIPDSPHYGGGVWHNLDPDLVRARKISFRGWVRSENATLATFWFSALKEPMIEEEKSFGKKFYEGLTEFAGYEEIPEHVVAYGLDTIYGSQDWKEYHFTLDISQDVNTAISASGWRAQANFGLTILATKSLVSYRQIQHIRMSPHTWLNRKI